MKPHLSKTKLEMLGRCGVQYEWRYVKGVKKPPAAAMIIGTGMHSAVEADLRNKLEWGSLLEEDDVKTVAADSVRTRWSETPPDIRSDEPNIGGAIDEAVALASLHHRELAPLIAPVSVESARRIELDGFPYDIELRSDVEEKERIRDLKTSAKAPSDADMQSLTLQGQIETLEAKLRGEPKPFVRDVFVKGRNRRIMTTPEIHATPDDHQEVLLRVEAAVRVLESGAFTPTTPDSWLCSARWCGYYAECAHGARHAVSVGLIDPARLASRASTMEKRYSSGVGQGE